MKKIITTLALASIATGVFAQGQVSWANLTGGLTTNSVTSQWATGFASTSGASGSGKLALTGTYYFTLLYDTATTPANNNPMAAGWTQVTVGGVAAIGTNALAAGDMEGPKGGGTMLPDNWAAGTAGSFIIVGWSANLGSTWSTVSGELAASWSNIAGYSASQNYWFGVTAMGTATPSSLPSGPTQLWPIVGNTFALNEVGPVPEPATMALAALGGASLLLFRRKK
jgi:hypothetical protein